MRLDKLEVQGFKSFAEKTEFVFQPGMTALVGPNGCGKSNVVDAVKWVLGEQSVKSLRGNDMQDVIFNGTPTRHPAAYCEATLTFANTRGLLPVEYETVAITRRLYRSGESEYYINKQRCRLKDIRDLFMDTGVGLDAYSLIEQGKVDVLLTTNKQDRRAIFEEAAGISKYKAQKKTCLSKLERVDANLLRLGDIIDEVEKRMRSVNYQAAKARRWKKLEEERRELAIALAMHQYEGLTKERGETETERTRLAAEVGALNASIERMEAELSALETSVIEADQAIAALQSEDVRIASQLQSAEEGLRLNEQRIVELNDLEERAKAEIAKAEASLELMRSEMTKVTADAAELEQVLAANQADLAARRDAMRQIEESVRGLRSQIEGKRSLGLQLASEHARQNNELATITAQCDQMTRQDSRLIARVEEQRRHLAESERQRQELLAKGSNAEGRIASLGQDRTAAEQRRAEFEATVQAISEQILAKRSEIASAASRAELLHDLEAKLEGLGAGVKSLREACGGERPELAGICGVIADLIEVDMEHAAAIEAALGTHEQLVITESFDDMTRAIDYLATGERGKANFLPLDAVGDHSHETRSHEPHPDIIGHAMDVVRHPEKFQRPLRSLLGDVLIVRNIEKAKELAASNGHGLRYATLDGQLLNPHGISIGGAARSVPGVISRRSELRAIDVKHATLEADLALLEQQRNEQSQMAAREKELIQRLTADVNAAQAELSGVRSELGQMENMARRIQTEIAAGESERGEITQHIQTLLAREAEVREAVKRLEEREAALKVELAEQEHLLGESEARRDQVRTEATELEVAQAQRQEQIHGLRRRHAELGRLIADREAGLAAAHEQVESCGRRRSESHEAILARKREIAELLDARGQIGARKAEAANQRELVRVKYEECREQRTAAGRNARESEAQLNKLNVHAAEVAMRIENLEGRAVSEFSCSLAERRTQDGQAVPSDVDWSNVAQEVELIQQKMKSMGAVNTYAIEELEELEKRSAELTTQRADLQRAEATLKEIIRKINKRSREMFEKTFNDVRENFQVLFRKLFGGGRADVVLEQDVDILDAGIDIIACPPGKEPSSITLLSGGEKALTAVALLFAVFRSKPSPFCILDEVDAPLDENNIDRFCLLVREFLKDSQFLVITHSRRTMAMADAMYGVTMQEPGISTRVAVRFNDDGANVAAAG